MKIKYLHLIALTAILLVAFTSFNYAQDDKVRQKAKDAFSEIETDSLVVRFFDALTGAPISKASVKVGQESLETDFEGRAFFKKPENDGLIKITFQHLKYITSEFEIEVMAGTLFFNRFSISPKLEIGALRVVLDWGENPKDLDAHLMKINDYHISFRNMIVSADGVARLDRDCTTGYGPETITANRIDQNSEYVFFVHDYTNQQVSGNTALSNSKAMIKVYGDNRLLNVISITPNGIGTFWEVFRIVNGEIKIVNEMKSVSN